MILGIDLGGKGIKIGAVEGGKILDKTVLVTPVGSDYDVILSEIVSASKKLTSKFPPIKAAGIGSPGITDTRRGKVLFSNNIRWSNRRIAADLQTELGLEVRLNNDAKCAALAEARFGAGRGFGRVLTLTLGTGVGGGFTVNGSLEPPDLYADAAGVFGHINVSAGGRECTCGRKGCLEAYASASALEKRAEESFLPVSAEEIFSRARKGDAEAAELVCELVYYLGEGAVSLSNALRPELIVLAGGVSASCDLILPELNRKLKNEVFGFGFAPVRAVQAELKDSGIIGAAALWQ